MPNIRHFIVCGIAVLFGFYSIAGGATLEEELYKVGQMRRGTQTPFDAVEARCAELFSTYPKPEDQAKIYFELVQVEGQSGFQRPDKVIGYIEKALKLPLEPQKELRLYIYWGDALQVSHRRARDGELVAARREAVVPYLHGLKKALDHQVPATAPSLPPELPVPNISGPNTPEFRKEAEEIRQRYQAQFEARRKAELQIPLIEYRDVLTNQIALMYSRSPFATEELEGLAMEILADKTAVEGLMSHVKAQIQERKQ